MTAALGLFGLTAIVPQCAPPPPIVQVSDVQDPIVASVNQYRAAAGRAQVTVDSRLTSAAQSHANDIAQRQVVTHTGTGGTNAGQRIATYGYGWTAWAENAAGGQQTAAEVMSAWMNSAGHSANILNGTMVNIGVAAAVGSNGVTYWVMVLAA
jgi:uncharacterized protein YkwD